jgi:hypothetical protein
MVMTNEPSASAFAKAADGAQLMAPMCGARFDPQLADPERPAEPRSAPCSLSAHRLDEQAGRHLDCARRSDPGRRARRWRDRLVSLSSDGLGCIDEETRTLQTLTPSPHRSSLSLAKRRPDLQG